MKKVIFYSRYTISSDDLSCLNLLYLPLIGHDAVSLYLFCASLLERSSLKSDEYDLDELLEILSWKYKKFEDAKTKLEGINLVKTYEKMDSIIIFLLAPLTPKNFISESNFGMYLSSKLGEESYLKLVNKFRIPDVNLTGYANVSKSFNEVFKTAIKTTNDAVDYNLMGKRPNKGSILSNFDFDFDLFLSKISKEFLPDGVTNDFKKKVNAIAYAYGYNIEQLVNLYNESINKKGNFDMETFKSRASRLYTYLTNSKAPKLVSKAEENDMGQEFENMTAEVLLASLTGEAPRAMVLRVAEMYENINLSRGVINVMIMSVYRDKKTIPTLSYFEKVAASWISKGIDSTALALKYVEEGVYPELAEYQSRTINKPKKVQPELADWQREGIDNILKGFGNNEES